MDFSIQPGLSSREALAVMNAAPKLGYNYAFRKEALFGTIPVGSVQYCESVLSPRLTQYPIDFYPEFLASRLYRKIGYGAFGLMENSGQYSPVRRPEIFLKPAKVWKGEFKSRIVHWNDVVPIDWYYWSEPVNFVNEWRYYIADGHVVDSGWYDGQDEDCPAPTFPFKRENGDMPYGWTAAVDMGVLENGELALVEVHAPFACGHYCESHENYLRWLQIGWRNYPVDGGAIFNSFRLKELGRF